MHTANFQCAHTRLSQWGANPNSKHYTLSILTLHFGIKGKKFSLKPLFSERSGKLTWASQTLARIQMYCSTAQLSWALPAPQSSCGTGSEGHASFSRSRKPFTEAQLQPTFLSKFTHSTSAIFISLLSPMPYVAAHTIAETENK